MTLTHLIPHPLISDLLGTVGPIVFDFNCIVLFLHKVIRYTGLMCSSHTYMYIIIDMGLVLRSLGFRLFTVCIIQFKNLSTCTLSDWLKCLV